MAIRDTIKNIPVSIVEWKISAGRTLNKSDIASLKKLIVEKKHLFNENNLRTILDQVDDPDFTCFCVQTFYSSILTVGDVVRIYKKQLHNTEFLELCVEIIDDINHLYPFLMQIDDNPNFFKKCLENPKLQILDRIFLMTRIDDPQYFKECLSNPAKIGVSSPADILALQLRTGDDEFIKQLFVPESISTQLDVPEEMTIGIEIEVVGSELRTIIPDGILGGWKDEHEKSLNEGNSGRELKSPILHGDANSTESIYAMCGILQQAGGKVTNKCGGHIHIGHKYLKDSMEEHFFLTTYANAEKILYMICNPENQNHRGIFFTKPASGLIEEDQRANGFATLSGLRTVQNSRGKVRTAISMLTDTTDTLEDGRCLTGATIEFRMPNGTIDPIIWIENINLFGGIVRAGKELANIYKKKPECRTSDEIEKLEAFFTLGREDASEQEKLSALLVLAIKERNREVYQRRYNANAVLLDQDENLKKEINEQIAQKPLVLLPKHIGRAVLTGPNAATGPEMFQAQYILNKSRMKSKESYQQ